MSIKGSPYTHFKRALALGNLTLIRQAAAELPSLALASIAPRRDSSAR